MTLGAVNEKARVVDHQVVIKEIITVGFTVDHRYTDGARAMRLLSKV